MGLRALVVSLFFALCLVLGLVLVDVVRGLLGSVVRIALVLVVSYVVYELVSGWQRGAGT